MKSLETIQKVAKFCKIFSKIAYVFCIISIIFLIIAGITALSMPNTITFNSKQLLIFDESENLDVEFSRSTFFDQCVVAAIIVIGELYLAKKAIKYFEFELEEGTPFTNKSANEIKNLGILTIAVPIIVSLVALIAHIIIKAVMENVADFEANIDISLSLGLFLLFLSAVFRYGASLTEAKSENTEEKEAEAEVEVEAKTEDKE